MSQNSLSILVMTGVILGEGCFFTLFLSRIAEEWRDCRRKEVEVILKEAKLVLSMQSALETFNGKLAEIKELEVQIYDICDRIEKRVSSLSADTMWTGGFDSGISRAPESETSGDSGD